MNAGSCLIYFCLTAYQLLIGYLIYLIDLKMFDWDHNQSGPGSNWNEGLLNTFQRSIALKDLNFFNSAWAIENADCMSAEGWNLPIGCQGYDTKQSDGEAPVLCGVPL